MARFAIIDAGRVVNHAEADDAFAQSQGWVPAGDSRIGDLWDGEKFTPAPPLPEPIPQQVTMRQARLELLKHDLLDDVEVVINAAGREAQIQWEYASTVDRDNQVIAIVQQQQGLTDEQIDDLFREAAKQ